MKSIHLWAARSVLADVALAGCQAATSKPVAEPEPEPAPPPPSLTGTWSLNNPDTEDDGQSFTPVILLASVGEGFIEASRRYDATGAVDGEWSHQGGWSATETTIVKKWYYHHENGHDAVTKQYHWGDDEHSILYVECWGCEGPDSQFTRLTRVPNALPDLTGAWIGYNDGRTDQLTVDGDRVTFSLSHPIDGENTHTGTGTLDPATYFISMTDVTNSDGELLEGDGIGRLAVAPAHDGAILVSKFWEESPIRDRIAADEHEEPFPYGGYHQLLKRVTP